MTDFEEHRMSEMSGMSGTSGDDHESRPSGRRVPGVFVRSECPECGDVRVPGTSVTARRPVGSSDGTACFRCPTCTGLVVRPVVALQIAMLAGAGIPVVEWEWPAELDEQHDGPPISHDELLDLHFALLEPDWYDRFLSRR